MMSVAGATSIGFRYFLSLAGTGAVRVPVPSHAQCPRGLDGIQKNMHRYRECPRYRCLALLGRTTIAPIGHRVTLRTSRKAQESRERSPVCFCPLGMLGARPEPPHAVSPASSLCLGYVIVLEPGYRSLNSDKAPWGSAKATFLCSTGGRREAVDLPRWRY